MILDYETADVAQFHDKFGVPMPSEVCIPASDVQEFRLKFLQEELDELKEAWEQGDTVKAFDALLDLVYVAKGTALLSGITSVQWYEGFNAVQLANLAKERVPNAEASKRGSALDIRKPAGWVGPEHRLAEILDGKL